MEEYVEAAIAAGIDEIGLTDHLFLYFQPPREREDTWAIREDEYDAHYAAMLEVRERYRDRIAVRVSVEADYVDGHEELLRQTLARYSFDYILGSVHFVDGWLIDDPASQERYRSEPVSDIYLRYYRSLQKAIESRQFDVLAHFDLPKKFGFRPERNLDDVVNDTLDLAAETGIAIEVSSAGLRKPVGEIYPSETILRGMKRRNIPIVLSSDAHDPREVGAGYRQLLTLIDEIGYREVTTFEARRATVRPISAMRS